MANNAANDQRDYTIHHWVGDHRNRPVNVFKKRVPHDLLRAYEVGRVQLILAHGIVSQRLKHVGNLTNVA